MPHSLSLAENHLRGRFHRRFRKLECAETGKVDPLPSGAGKVVWSTRGNKHNAVGGRDGRDEFAKAGELPRRVIGVAGDEDDFVRC